MKTVYMTIFGEGAKGNVGTQKDLLGIQLPVQSTEFVDELGAVNVTPGNFCMQLVSQRLKA